MLDENEDKGHKAVELCTNFALVVVIKFFGEGDEPFLDAKPGTSNDAILYFVQSIHLFLCVPTAVRAGFQVCLPASQARRSDRRTKKLPTEVTELTA